MIFTFLLNITAIFFTVLEKAFNSSYSHRKQISEQEKQVSSNIRVIIYLHKSF